MAEFDVEALKHDLDLYGRFIAKLGALVAHRFIMNPTGKIMENMKPTGETIESTGKIIEHWSSKIYAFGDHAYHLVHSTTNILIPIILFLLLFRVSYKMAKSTFHRDDGTPGYLLLLLYKCPGISHIRNWLRKLKNSFDKEE